jgi:hypothetical protein
MVSGRVVTPPVRYGAKVTSVDDSEAKKVPGFIQAVVVKDPTNTVTGWVVAVAKTYPEAIKADAQPARGTDDRKRDLQCRRRASDPCRSPRRVSRRQ